MVSQVLARDLADPHLSLLVISDVSVTDDLSVATVTVRMMVETEQSEKDAAMATLHRLSPRIRSMLAPELRMRRVPEVRFRYDAGHDHAQRIEAVLDEIHREEEARPAPSSDTAANPDTDPEKP